MKNTMHLFGCLFFGIFLAAWSSAAFGASNPHSADSAALAFKNAVKNNNAHYVSGHMAYPIYLYVAGGKMQTGGPLTAEDGYKYWMTPYLYNLITKTPPSKLVKLLEIRKGTDGVYRVHNLLFAGNPADFKYSKDGIYSAKGLMRVIAALREGASKRCASCVAKVIAFPIPGCVDGKHVKIRNPAEFKKYYSQIVTPEVRGIMLHAWQRHDWTGFPDKGIMLGPNGDIWIQSLGHKNAKGFWVWETKVTALQEVGSCPVQ